MIRTIIQAGFGNQLFQYATAYSLAKDLGQDLELDVSFYDEKQNVNANNHRENELIHLNLSNPSFTSKKNGFRKYRYITKVKFLQKQHLNGNPVPLICEDVANCREDQRSRFNIIGDSGAVLYGFWQNTKYFDRYRADLSQQFRPNYELDSSAAQMLNRVNSSLSVGVHIRRGDFVNLGWDKGRAYYDKGMNLLRKRVEGVVFFVVSDDVDWARRQYGNQKDVIIVDICTATKDIDEFFILSSCKHQLISESTFGWWAAYLSANENKIVVVPSEAVGELFDRDWIKI